MARWIPQSTVFSASKSAVARTAYLASLVPRIDSLIREYFGDRPRGETVTVHVLAGLGRDALLGAAGGRTFETVKQDVGRLVAIRLGVIFAPQDVETYREGSGKNPSTRPAPAGSPDWVSHYTPHRVRHRGVEGRIVLDTMVVRDMLHGEAHALALDRLAELKGDRPVSLADPAWAEIVAFLQRHPRFIGDWHILASKLTGVLDPTFPIVPSGREAVALAGIFAAPGYDVGLASAHYRAVWALTASVARIEDFSRVVTYAGPHGDEYQLGPVDPERVVAEFARRQRAWQQFVRKTLMSIEQPVEEAVNFVRADLERDFPSAAVDQMGLYVRVLATVGVGIRSGQLVAQNNDGVDLDILFTTLLPAWVCTSEHRLVALAERSGSSDGYRVMTPATLLARLAAG